MIAIGQMTRPQRKAFKARARRNNWYRPSGGQAGFSIGRLRSLLDVLAQL